MKRLKESELILNPDGSLYHIHLRPEHLARKVILVGDPQRVPMISSFFDKIEFVFENREIVTHTGKLNNVRLTVMSTGMGPDNIDIVMNELDALVNVDLDRKCIKEQLTSLNIVRIGTSGSLQADIPVDSMVLGRYGLGFDGLLHFYRSEGIFETEIEDSFIFHTGYPEYRSRPYVVKNDERLGSRLGSDEVHSGITATAVGFYGPQGRVLRLGLDTPQMNKRIESFRHGDLRISNLEMETAAIYGLSKLLGHRAASMNAIIANRATLTFSKDPYKAVDRLIEYTLNQLII